MVTNLVCARITFKLTAETEHDITDTVIGFVVVVGQKSVIGGKE